jgi:hypothetical protein
MLTSGVKSNVQHNVLGWHIWSNCSITWYHRLRTISDASDKALCDVDRIITIGMKSWCLVNQSSWTHWPASVKSSRLTAKKPSASENIGTCLLSDLLHFIMFAIHRVTDTGRLLFFHRINDPINSHRENVDSFWSWGLEPPVSLEW